ncbi:MAG: hypothetical protein OEZ36_14210, partial [Spirochaetota bacterium]|nr:hypothetical protein [Spirochaetota bacterium]
MNNDSILIPNFKIEVDGAEITPDVRVNVEALELEEELNLATMFLIRLSSFDFNDAEWNYLDLDIFKIGGEIKIAMGFDKPEPLMVGEITSLEPFFSQSESYIEIRGYDRLHRLGIGKKTRSFKDVKDSDIVSTIAGDWSLTPETENTDTLYPHVFQNNQSDLNFLLTRARRLGFELSVRDKTLHFNKPKINESPEITLEHKKDFTWFSARLNAKYQSDEILVQGWDFVKKEALSAKAKDGDELSKMKAEETTASLSKKAFGEASSAIVDEGLIDKTEAETIAIAQYNTQLVESLTGEGLCDGEPK